MQIVCGLDVELVIWSIQPEGQLVWKHSADIQKVLKPESRVKLCTLISVPRDSNSVFLQLAPRLFCKYEILHILLTNLLADYQMYCIFEN